jgi:hypothetical protein
MERYCLTDQSPQRAVAPTEEEEEYIYIYIYIGPASLEALTAVLMKMQALRFVTPCRLVSSYRLLSLDELTMKTEALRCLETLLTTSKHSVFSRNILVFFNMLVTFGQRIAGPFTGITTYKQDRFVYVQCAAFFPTSDFQAC